METAAIKDGEAAPANAVAERPSRPPGFDMTYRPAECVFGPPFSARVPSLLYFALAVVVGLLVLAGERSNVDSGLFHFVVESDPTRVLGIRTLAAVLFIGSIASIVRAGMRGVRIFGDGIETRDIEYLVVPRVRRYRWPQIERMLLDLETTVAVDLWDGRCAYFPPVGDRDKLKATLEHVAAARAIPVRGGPGLDELPDPGDRESVSNPP
jgi:hypothetical protein